MATNLSYPTSACIIVIFLIDRIIAFTAVANRLCSVHIQFLSSLVEVLRCSIFVLILGSVQLYQICVNMAHFIFIGKTGVCTSFLILHIMLHSSVLLFITVISMMVINMIILSDP